MNQEINKYLTEAMGLKYVKSDNNGNVWIEINDVNIGKITIIKGGWELFGMRWEWAIKQDWWDKFQHSYLYDPKKWASFEELINPENFANAIYNFLKEKHEKE